MTDTAVATLQPAEVREDLRPALAAHPLPDGVSDADMNQDEIAAAFQKSVNTVSKWTKQGMPFVEEGGPGRSYVYRLSHCWAWFQAQRARDESQARHNAQQVASLQALFYGIDTTAQPGAVLDPKQRREMAQADLAFHQAARLRRSRVPIADVVDLCEGLLVAAREAFDGLADRLERELSLNAAQLVAVQRAGADAINAMRAQITDASLTEVDLAGDEEDLPWAR